MNYGKKNLSKRKKALSSKKRMKKKRVGVRFFKALIICIILLGIICGGFRQEDHRQCSGRLGRGYTSAGIYDQYHG